MALLHFHSYHPLSCEEGIIYSQGLRYNMIIWEDHILQTEFNILLPRTYPLHLIIKNIKKALTHSNFLLSQRTPHTETNIVQIITPFPDMGKQLTAIIHRNWHIVANDTTLSTIWPSKPLSAYTKSNSIHNHFLHSAKTYGASQRNPYKHYPYAPTYNNTDVPTYDHSGHARFLLNTGHNQLILMPRSMNRTSIHLTKILVSSNDYEAYQRPHPHAVNLGSSIMHC